ncbi:hypothetical protein INS49_007365 [Diaporthe citri]|uniref:uncharacterized protein n=1 Tax=Diaporthe citri TaxID=83186 RepID=UPI001C815030|nr:uncharacterized protein INS49_007365 [Diaporthe citri]KAG6365754.1 hypothetical protein INS49_007365 [Diaporthe citri]
MAKTETDELCQACSNIDLYSVFTGPRYFPHDATGHRGGILIYVGTLRGVLDNTRCPLCRLIKHDLYSALSQDTARNLWYGSEEQPDPPRVRCYLRPVRADYYEETKYTAKETRDQVATLVMVTLLGVEGCSAEEENRIRCHHRGNGLRLLSPHSVDPSRPLLNGYRATSLAQSLTLLSSWIKTCCHSHQDTCGLSGRSQQHRLDRLRLIDVAARTLVHADPEVCSYAALSYVWGHRTEEYLKFADEIQQGGDEIAVLPSSAPGIIEDGIDLCGRLGIPFLWVDLYCVDQHNPDRKAADIKDMGLIYRQALITFVAGGSGSRLLHSAADSLEKEQLVESIRGKSYITSSVSITSQLQGSAWNQRGWTYQEGSLAQRIAFFGERDVSFLCGAGHWRGCLHSGKYGHSAHIKDLNLRSRSHYTLAANEWLRDSEWSFGDFETTLSVFSERTLTYESDKLNAIAGCLDMLGRQKGTHFVHGLPSVDFHYALLWGGEYDRRRPGFPSWSWAGWHALRQTYSIVPDTGSSGELRDDGTGQLRLARVSTSEVSLGGLLLNGGIENPTPANRCSQNVAHIVVKAKTLTITSDIAHFSFAIVSSPTYREELENPDRVPSNFDSLESRTSVLDWDLDREYRTPFERIRLADVSGNACQYHYPYWYDHWPCIMFELPRTLRGSTLTWLLRDGIDLVKIVEVKLLEGEDGLRKFHHVLCLGVDRSDREPGRGRRLGVFCLSGEIWARASPREDTIELV